MSLEYINKERKKWGGKNDCCKFVQVRKVQNKKKGDQLYERCHQRYEREKGSVVLISFLK